jgi:hypothetical protein
MAFRKKTLRNMKTNTRKLARLINDLESATYKLKNFIPTVATMELERNALYNRLSTAEKKGFAKEFEQIVSAQTIDLDQTTDEIPHTDDDRNIPIESSPGPLFDQLTDPDPLKPTT